MKVKHKICRIAETDRNFKRIRLRLRVRSQSREVLAPQLLNVSGAGVGPLYLIDDGDLCAGRTGYRLFINIYLDKRFSLLCFPPWAELGNIIHLVI